MILTATFFYKQDPVEFNSRRVVTFNGLVLKFSFLHIKNNTLKSLKSKELPDNNYCVK